MQSLNTISHIELQQIVSNLEQAIYSHVQWHNALLRTLICRVPADQNDMENDAHIRCRFGQWYYANSPKSIQNHPGFLEIGEAHKRMHQLTKHLLELMMANRNISPLEYDQFANALEQMRLEIAALKNELEYLLNNRDSLTGAITRVSMLPILREQQELAKRQNQPCCIAMVDLDLFKNVNDRYGHSAGDLVLTTVARYLIENLRPYDKVFRYGGEEFLLCIPFTSLEHGNAMVDRIRSGLASLPIDIGLEKPIHVTASIGFALLDTNLSVEDSIIRADKALYSAKSSGRNKLIQWETSLG